MTYPALDVWRGLAVLWVLLYHLELAFGLHVWAWLHRAHQVTGVPFETWLARIPDLGFLGVDLFFVLSGFLITGLLEPELERGVDAPRFLARRFFKIVPHYLVAVLAGLALTYGVGDPALRPDVRVWPYFALVQNYQVPVPILSHTWSLAVEEHFYLLYPLVLLTVPRARLPLVLAALMLGVAIARQVSLVSPAGPPVPPLAHQMTHLRLDAILAGCLLRLTVPALRGLAKYLALAGAALIGARFLCYGFDPYRGHHYTLAYLAAALVIAATFEARPRGLGWLAAVGRTSYATYLWHPHVIFLVGQAVSRGRRAALVAGLLALAAGALATRTLEARFLAMRRRWAP